VILLLDPEDWTWWSGLWNIIFSFQIDHLCAQSPRVPRNF
jgi:hypothetical protein